MWTKGQYHLVGRIHPKELAKAVAQMAETRLRNISTNWILAWRDEVCSEARETFKVPVYCKGDLSVLESLLSAFQAYDALHGEPITMRAFSAQIYHDTKYFEHTQRKTLI